MQSSQAVGNPTGFHCKPLIPCDRECGCRRDCVSSGTEGEIRMRIRGQRRLMKTTRPACCGKPAPQIQRYDFNG